MTKDDATWLSVAYVAFAVLSGFFLFQAFDTLGVQTGWLERYDWWTPVATLLAVVIGVAGAGLLRAYKQRNEYFLSCIAELRKVSWPTWTDTKRMTLIVVVVVGIFAVIVGLFDLVWAGMLKNLIA